MSKNKAKHVLLFLFSSNYRKLHRWVNTFPSMRSPNEGSMTGSAKFVAPAYEISKLKPWDYPFRKLMLRVKSDTGLDIQSVKTLDIEDGMFIMLFIRR